MRVHLKGKMELADPALVEFTRHSLEFALGHMCEQVERVEVDVPVGGSAHHATIEVELRNATRHRSEWKAENLFVAIECAADRIGKSIGRLKAA